MCKGTVQKGNFKLIDVVWFECMESTIGVVVCFEIKKKEFCSFIGRGKGKNEIEDALSIIDWGAPFPYEAAITLFGEELNAKESVRDDEIIGCYLKLMMLCQKQIQHCESKMLDTMIKSNKVA